MTGPEQISEVPEHETHVMPAVDTNIIEAIARNEMREEDVKEYAELLKSPKWQKALDQARRRVQAELDTAA